MGPLALNAPETVPHYFGSFVCFRVFESHQLVTQAVVCPASHTPDTGGYVPFAQDALPCLLRSVSIGAMSSYTYFEHIHTQYPFLHEATFKTWKVSIVNPSDELNVNPIAAFFVNMVS